MPKSDGALSSIALRLAVNKEAALEPRNQLAEGEKSYLSLSEWQCVSDTINMINVGD